MNIIEKRAYEDNEKLEKWFEEASSKYPLKGNITIKKDIPYIEDGNERHTFDIYYKDSCMAKPIILDFHGGGFISGNKKYNQWMAERLAESGFIVCVFAYPLTFEEKLYDILRDCYEGMIVAKDYVKKLGGDINNIFLCGDSAGGFLATYLAAIDKDANVARSVGTEQVNIGIKAVGVISALFYCSRVDKNGLFVMRSTLLGKNYRKHSFWRYVNPEKELYNVLPPLYAITSGGDFLKSYTVKFVKFLNEKGKNASMYVYEDKMLEHDFVCLKPEIDESKEAVDKMSDFFKTILARNIDEKGLL